MFYPGQGHTIAGETTGCRSRRRVDGSACLPLLRRSPVAVGCGHVDDSHAFGRRRAPRRARGQVRRQPLRRRGRPRPCHRDPHRARAARARPHPGHRGVARDRGRRLSGQGRRGRAHPRARPGLPRGPRLRQRVGRADRPGGSRDARRHDGAGAARPRPVGGLGAPRLRGPLDVPGGGLVGPLGNVAPQRRGQAPGRGRHRAGLQRGQAASGAHRAGSRRGRRSDRGVRAARDRPAAHSPAQGRRPARRREEPRPQRVHARLRPPRSGVADRRLPDPGRSPAGPLRIVVRVLPA